MAVHGMGMCVHHDVHSWFTSSDLGCPDKSHDPWTLLVLTPLPAMLYLKPCLKSVDDASTVLPKDLELTSKTT